MSSRSDLQFIIGIGSKKELRIRSVYLKAKFIKSYISKKLTWHKKTKQKNTIHLESLSCVKVTFAKSKWVFLSFSPDSCTCMSFNPETRRLSVGMDTGGIAVRSIWPSLSPKYWPGWPTEPTLLNLKLPLGLLPPPFHKVVCLSALFWQGRPN